MAGILAPHLLGNVGDSVELTICYRANNPATGEIKIRPGQVPEVVDVLQRLKMDTMRVNTTGPESA